MNQYLKILVGIIAVIVLYLGFMYLGTIIAYICLSAVLSLIGSPLARFLTSKTLFGNRIPRSFAALLTLCCFYMVILGFIGLILPVILEQIRNLGEVDFDSVADNVQIKLDQADDWITKIFGEPERSAGEYLQQEITNFIKPSRITDIFGGVLGFLGSAVAGIFSVSFITFFLLREEGLMKSVIFSFIPEREELRFQNVYATSKQLLTRYFIGVLLQTICIGTLVTIGMLIVGVDNALLIGFSSGLLNIIPYIGPAIGVILGVIIVALTNPFISLSLMFSVLSVYVIVQILDNIFFQPLIFANSVNAHPLEIFLLIIVSATLGGVPMMIIAIPFYTVLRVIAKEFLSEFKVVKSLTKRL